MIEQNQQAGKRQIENDSTVDLHFPDVSGCIETFDPIVLPSNGEVIRYRILGEAKVRTAYLESSGWADRKLSQEEIKAIHDLLRDHPEIKSWRIKNNVLYLEVDE